MASATERGGGLGLGEFVLLALVAGGPPHLRLVDNAALHRAVVSEHLTGQRGCVLSQLGHRPDKMVGRRVTGLDDALRQLIDEGQLVAVPGARWRIAAGAAVDAHDRLAALPFERRRAVGAVATRWRELTERETHR